MDKFHYFATHALGYAVADTRDEAIANLLLQNTDPKWVRNCLKDGNFVTVYSTRVHADSKAAYKIEWYQPVGVETSEGQNDLVTYLTKTKFAVSPDGNDRAVKYSARLEERTQLLRNLAYSVATSESLHDSNIVKYLAEAKEFIVPDDAAA